MANNTEVVNKTTVKKYSFEAKRIWTPSVTMLAGRPATNHCSVPLHVTQPEDGNISAHRNVERTTRIVMAQTQEPICCMTHRFRMYENKVLRRILVVRDRQQRNVERIT
jgi:hypothetical protein